MREAEREEQRRVGCRDNVPGKEKDWLQRLIIREKKIGKCECSKEWLHTDYDESQFESPITPHACGKVSRLLPKHVCLME